MASSLVAIFSILASIVTAFAYVAYNGIYVLHSYAEEISRYSIPRIISASELRSDMIAIQAGYFIYITGSDQELLSDTENKIAHLQKSALTKVDNARKLAPDAKEAALLATIDKALGDLSVRGKEVLSLSKMSQVDGATVLLGQVMKESEPAFSAVAELVNLAKSHVDHAVLVGNSAYSQARITAFVVVGLTMIVVIISSFYAYLNIGRPIRTIAASITNLAQGDTDSDIPFVKRTDEVGEIALAVEVFRRAAISKLKMDAEAERTRQEIEAERERAVNEANLAADKRLRDATSAIASGLTRLSTGDLAFQLTEPMARDFEPLRNDFNASIRQLREALALVSGSAEAIKDSSREIEGSAINLSSRTEQQAAVLEETAAALDTITSKVSSAARRAEEVKGIVNQATSGAAHSARVVTNAVEAMQRIESSSSQIANIIGVIDEIAFQTNLLALNAGVEAARAGEAGKGFAVVAQEVRELAQRSAIAAKEIKELIHKSGSEVKTGVHLVEDTGEALKLIEGHVIEINHCISSIASSTAEQAAGLAEVNAAVSRLDQVTQQNAAMVEETSAASAVLANEAGRLNRLVAGFNVSDVSSKYEGISDQPSDDLMRPVIRSA